MRATEAAKLADVIQRHGNIDLLYKVNGHWFDKNGDVVDVNSLCNDDYTPLVPLKTYKVGDMVTFAEALQSGMCFQGNKCKLVYLFRNIPQENRWFSSWSNATMEWIGDASPFNWLTRQNFTIVPDPSIPPKPTIESLAPGTLFKAVEAVSKSTRECVRCHHSVIADNDTWYSPTSSSLTLTHIKRNGQWEEV